MKRWPKVVEPNSMPSTLKRTISVASVSGPKVARMECSGRTQRSASGRIEASPQRMDLGQGKLLMTAGMISARRSMVAAPGARSPRHRTRPSLGPSDLRLGHRGEPRAFQKSLDRRPRARRRADPFFLRGNPAGGRAIRRYAGPPGAASAKLAAPSKRRPRSARASPTRGRFKSSASRRCMRAGISSLKSSRRSSGMGSGC